MKNKKLRKAAIWFLLFLSIALFVSVTPINNKTIENSTNSYNTFLLQLERNEVVEVNYKTGDTLLKYKTTKSKKHFYVENPRTDTFKEMLLLQNVKVTEKSQGNILLTLSTLLPILLIGGVLVFVFQENFTEKIKKSKKSNTSVSFDDIAGMEEIKNEIKEISLMLCESEKYEKAGARLPRGILFEGPPGNGKTMLAQALANEQNFGFVSANASEFVHKYAGAGSKKIRNLFEKARSQAPCVIFIDEFDAIGVSRSSGKDSAEMEYVQCVNTLLSELDGFNEKEKVLVIAATNRAACLDSALTRAGRFDKKIYIGNPDLKTRFEILKKHGNNKTFSDDVDFMQIAKDTFGYSGADLENLLNESVLVSLRKNKKKISINDIDEAQTEILVKGKIKKGAEVRSSSEIEIIAFHEAGHAVIQSILTNDPVTKVTILPTTSNTGGYTQISCDQEKNLHTICELKKMICVFYAGRASEQQLNNGDVDLTTLGASDDVSKATALLKQIVPYTVSTTGVIDYSLFTHGEKHILEAIEQLSQGLYHKTLSLVKAHWSEINAVAKMLIEKNTLYHNDIKAIIGAAKKET